MVHLRILLHLDGLCLDDIYQRFVGVLLKRFGRAVVVVRES
jgi:hypothetical protein